jgi:hypothetical protein
MMTDEELEQLKTGFAEQIEALSGEGRALSKEERKRKLLLEAKIRALDRIKEAREKGSSRQEVRACVDYALLEEYGHRHWIIYNLAKSRMSLMGF